MYVLYIPSKLTRYKRISTRYDGLMVSYCHLKSSQHDTTKMSTKNKNKERNNIMSLNTRCFILTLYPRHDIAEIMLMLALNINQSINQSINLYNTVKNRK